MASIETRRFVAKIERRTEEMVSAITFLPIREMRRVRDELREMLGEAANSALREQREVAQAIERMRGRIMAAINGRGPREGEEGRSILREYRDAIRAMFASYPGWATAHTQNGH